MNVSDQAKADGLTDSRRDTDGAPPECDVLIFVATRAELDAVRKAAAEQGLQFDERSTVMGAYVSLGTIGGHRVVAVKTSTGGLGPRGSSANARFYLEATGATSLICVGMAFGIDRNTQRLGDVLVSSHVFPYDDRYVAQDQKKWWYDYARRDIRMYRAKSDLVKMLERYKLGPGKSERIAVGCLLTGSALIASSSYRDELVLRCGAAAKNIVGGEMEGVGLLGLHPRERCCWLIVKGISDFADGVPVTPDEEITNKRDACENAARAVLRALAAWTPPVGGLSSGSP